jgi:hypothetical protein
LFTANLVVGSLGGLLEQMTATRFWLLHAGPVATGALLLLFLRAMAKDLLAPQAVHPA